jgi:tRNA(fMet)-specific endonuclease VapC
MHYLLDTNALIAILNDGRSSVSIKARRHRTDAIAISSIVMHKLYFGAYKSQNIARNMEAVRAMEFPVISFDKNDADHSAEIRFFLRRLGMPIGHYDLLIAGQARARNMTLITHNIREFARVPHLKIEDWQS